jgi:hypothetical protein
MKRQYGFGFLHIFGLILIFLIATIGFQTYQKRAARLAEEHAEAVRVERVSKELQVLIDLSRELADAAQLAAATGRIAMATLVARLQDVHRRIQNATASDCALQAKAPLDMQAGFMSHAFISFMSNSGGTGEAVAKSLFERAEDQKSKFQAAVAVCRESLQLKPVGVGAAG